MEPHHAKMLFDKPFPFLALNKSRCRLLELPRELRDEIYKPALAFDEGLSVTEDMKLHPTTLRMRVVGKGGFSHPEANTLKYTFRQIYAETKNFTLKVNDTFTFNSTTECNCGLDRLLRLAPVFHTIRNEPRLVNIHPHAVFDWSAKLTEKMAHVLNTITIRRLATFCRQFPTTKVRLYFQHPLRSYKDMYNAYPGLNQCLRGLRGETHWTVDPDSTPECFAFELFISIWSWRGKLPKNIRILLKWHPCGSWSVLSSVFL
jgi:hypothetical protein